MDRVFKLIEASERLESEGSGVSDIRADKECLVYFLASKEGVIAIKALPDEIKLRVGDAVETLAKFGVLSREDAQAILALLKHEDLVFRARMWYAADTLLEGNILKVKEMSKVTKAYVEIFEEGDTVAKFFALRVAPYLVEKGVIEPEVLREDEDVYKAVEEVIMAISKSEMRKVIVATVLDLIHKKALEPRALDRVKPLVLSDLKLTEQDVKLLTIMVAEGVINASDKQYLVRYLEHPDLDKRAVYWLVSPLLLDRKVLTKDELRGMLEYLNELLVTKIATWGPARALFNMGVVGASELKNHARYLFKLIGSSDDCLALRILIDLLNDGILSAKDFEEYKSTILSPERLKVPCTMPLEKIDVLVEKGVITDRDRELILNLLESPRSSLVVAINAALIWSRSPVLVERKIITPEDIKQRVPTLMELAKEVRYTPIWPEFVEALQKLAAMGVIDFGLDDLMTLAS